MFNIWNVMVVFSTIVIWTLLLVSIALVIAGYIYYLKWTKTSVPKLDDQNAPFVSIMVPAHNESIVIVKTVQALLKFNYPHDRYEIIVINDNSDDDSAELLAKLQQQHPTRNFKVINTDNVTGGKGKSNALNIGFKSALGDIIAIYDADNTPEPNALRYLVAELIHHPQYGAVIGKFRTRNKDVDLLTRFINVETLSFQWMAQAGRSELFKLCTIPGTNYVIRRSIIEKIGGWDDKALAEDTEISFHLYRMGYRIKFQPAAVTWEQEPQTMDVWFHQRTRWVQGNIYVIVKNFKLLFDHKARRIWFDLIYFMSTYFLLLTALLMSDFTFIMSVSGYAKVTVPSFSNLLWFLAIVLYVVSVYVSISTEKGEMRWSNILVILLMYVIYSQMWLIVALKGMYLYIKENVFHIGSATKWYKTKRYK